jgi:CRP-like cAMP-binding protein
MTNERVEEILKGIPLFEKMGRGELARIARFAGRVQYGDGEVIIREGDIDDRLFVVLSGEVKAVKDYQGPRERTLGFVREGMFFGEMALLDNYERTATVVANSEVHCLEVRHLDFMELVRAHPQLAVLMLPVLARRLRTAQDLL